MVITYANAEKSYICDEDDRTVGHVKLLDLSLKLCILSSEIIPAAHHARLSEKIRHHCPGTGAAEQTVSWLSGRGTDVLQGGKALNGGS